MTGPAPDATEHLRKYGAIDFAPVRKPKPRNRLFTPAEVEELRQLEARMAETQANAAYLGWPARKPLHPDPIVCELAEMLLKEFER